MSLSIEVQTIALHNMKYKGVETKSYDETGTLQMLLMYVITFSFVFT